jgi:hypothetical protein
LAPSTRIRPTQVGIISDKQNRQRYQQEDKTFKDPLDCLVGVPLGQNHQHHYYITQFLDIPLKTDKGILRPGNADATIDKVQKNEFVFCYPRSPFDSSSVENKNAG